MPRKLSFTSDYNFWTISEAPKDFREANAIGRAYGEEFFAEIRESRFTPLLGHIIRSTASKGRFGPVEIGFCQAVAAAAVTPPNTPARHTPDCAP